MCGSCDENARHRDQGTCLSCCRNVTTIFGEIFGELYPRNSDTHGGARVVTNTQANEQKSVSRRQRYEVAEETTGAITQSIEQSKVVEGAHKHVGVTTQ